MATPSGPCLSPWRESLSERFYRIKKRKPIDTQAVQSSAKRRCFPHSSQHVSSLSSSTSVSPGRPKREQRIPSQHVACGHDSLLHGHEMEAPFIDRTSGSESRVTASRDVDMDDITVPQSADPLRARVEELTNTLQFMKEHDISSNDYWAVPQETQLRMQEELEQARSSMETDFVPNPDQYRPASSIRNNNDPIFSSHSLAGLQDPPHFF